MSNFDEYPFSVNFPRKPNSKMRIIFHVDFDYFFAQCEEVRNSKIKNSPVVVCVYSGREPDSGVVSTSNYLARKYGVKSGLPIRFAKNKLRSIESFFLPLDLEYYKDISNKIMSIINSFSHQLEIRGIDECYVDITELAGNKFENSIKLAENLKKEIKDQTKISSSVGISFNKILAKMASDHRKPDGIFLIDFENHKEIVYPFSIDKVPGIGPKTKIRLNETKIATVGQLVETDLDVLNRLFGKKIGYKLHNVCSPDVSELKNCINNQKQLMKIMTLKKEHLDYSNLKNTIEKISNAINSNVIKMGYVYKNISLILILEDLFNVTKSKNMKVYSSDKDQLILHSTDLLNEILKSVNIKDIRRIGIKVSDLKLTTGQNSLNQYF